MNQKVWVISDQDWNRSPAKAPPPAPGPESPPETGPPTAAPIPSAPAQKSPALVFSLSLLLWGGGFRYLGERRPAAFCMTAMALFGGIFAALILCRVPATRLLVRHGLQLSPFALGVEILFLAGLLFWLGNAVAAYHRALASRTERYLGGDRKRWPFLASLVLPGWGQFLNGQELKGVCFLACALLGGFSLFVLAVTHALWPLLQAEPGRRLFEAYLTAALLALPLLLLIWLVGAYDAYRSCQRLQRRKLCLKNPGYRPGRRRLLRALLPSSSAVLGLLLAISLGMQFAPRSFYRDSLSQARAELLQQRVEILPDLLQKAIRILGP